MKMVAENRKARHDYHIEEVIETGLVLTGTEVKSVRKGSVNLRDSYASVDNGEMFLHHVHIAPYEQGNRANHDPYRSRKLLLHRREIDRLMGRVKERGYTLVPLKLYFNARGRAKLELGLCRGKKQYDKRDTLRERDARRDVERAIKERQRS